MRVRDIKICGIANPSGFCLSGPSVSWKVDETKSMRQLSSRLSLERSGDLVWQTEGQLDSLGEPLEAPFEPRANYLLRVEVEGDAGDRAAGELSFFTGKMDEPWQGRWIGTAPEDSFHPVFERDFELRHPVVQATLHICGLGLFEACLNGSKVGCEYLTPYYNDYSCEQQVIAFDVTKMLACENRLEVFLGNGWYKGRFAMNQEAIYGDRFALAAELHVCYEDGRHEVIATDDSWRYRASDIEESDIYDGEVLNRLLWEAAPNPWHAARTLDMPTKTLVDRYSLPVVARETLPVRELIHTPAGEAVLDFGQNFAGWVQFESKLPRGARVTLDFGEVLQDGNFYNENYRTAKSQFVYVSDGREELVRPHFTYFGFRYVRVTGWEGEPDPANFTGIALYSNMERTGRFACDNEKLNRLYENTLWGMRSNFIDLPTDCPQRDERLGWCGDAQVFAPTATLHMDTRAFYEKFLRDLSHYQRRLGGAVPVCIPEAEAGGAHMTSAAWSDVATLLPWQLYESYGDIKILEAWYPMMAGWVDYVAAECGKQGPDHYLWDFGFQFGDWLALDGKDEQACQGGTEEFFVSSVYHYMSCELAARAARRLAEAGAHAPECGKGYAEQARRYDERAERVRDAILDEYFTPAGRLAVDTQTAYVLALRSGVYRSREVVVRQLMKRFDLDGFKITGGFVGAPVLCQTLADNGMEDLAWQFLMSEDYPGWLNCVNLGATTVWERWNSVLSDGHMSGTGMNSLNHYSFGNVAQFFYENAAGIRREGPGYREAAFRPQITGLLRSLSASYDSPQGTYALEWRIDDDGMVSIACDVPFGGRATLAAPRYDGGEIELAPGHFELSYMPTSSYLKRFDAATPVGDILTDPKGAAFIAAQAPALLGICEMGGDACKAMTLADMLGVAMQMCGLAPEEAERIKVEVELV